MGERKIIWGRKQLQNHPLHIAFYRTLQTLSIPLLQTAGNVIKYVFSTKTPCSNVYINSTAHNLYKNSLRKKQCESNCSVCTFSGSIHD
jgi:hypothetical protein